MTVLENIVAKETSLWSEIFNYLEAGGNNFANGNEVLRSYKSKPYHYLSAILNNDRGSGTLTKAMAIGLVNINDLQKIYGRNEYICLGGLGDALRCQRLYIPYASSCSIKRGLHDCWIENDHQKLIGIKQLIVDLLRCKKINKIIVSTDSLPFERLVISAGRVLGIKSYCFQHGLFSGKIPEINDGKYADTIFCYDSFQCNILTKSGAKNPIAIGYPFGHSNNSECRNRGKVVFIGQPWYRYYNDKLDGYINIIKKLNAVCERSGLKLVYKSHPAENLKINNIIDGLEIFNGDLQAAFNSAELFCSLSSTALLQASIAGKVAIQIYDENFILEKYEDFGYCYTRLIDDENGIVDCLKYSTPMKISSINNRSKKIESILRSDYE